MNNASKYNKSRLNLLLKGFIPSLVTLFLPRKKKLVILNSFHNRLFCDNTKFLFEYMIKNCSYLTVKYVVNDDMLRYELIQKYGNHFIETNSLRGMFYALFAKVWILNALELPVSGVFLKFRRKVVLLTHGVTSKQTGLAEKKVSILKQLYYSIIRTNLSYVLTTCSEFKNVVASHFGISEKQMIVSGFPRFDSLLRNEYVKLRKEENETSVLYAPTWRHYADVKLFPFEDFNKSELEQFCTARNIKFYIRVHPRFENNIPEKIRNLSFVKIFSGSQFPDINDYLPNFDMMITDYSSIFYDFMILDRPLFFFMYDIEEYEKEIGLAVDFNKFAAGYKPKTQREFLQNMNDALVKDSFAEKRRSVRNFACGQSKNNCKDLVKTLSGKKILISEENI